MMRLASVGGGEQFALLLLAFTILGIVFWTSDFSVGHVAQHSYSLLPWGLKLAAVWAVEGLRRCGAVSFRLERAVGLCFSA
ncbi:hypothetical protein ACNKHK_26615 [Shigella flexneri]